MAIISEGTLLTTENGYIVEYFSQNDIIKNKIRETTLKHFDGIGFQDSVIKSKFDQTMLKKLKLKKFNIKVNM